MKAAISMQVAADQLGVSFATVYRLVRAGHIRSMRVGRRRLIHEDDLQRFIDQARAAANPVRAPRRRSVAR